MNKKNLKKKEKWKRGTNKKTVVTISWYWREHWTTWFVSADKTNFTFKDTPCIFYASVRTTGISMFTLTLSSYFGSPEGWLHINVVINWQLSKHGIRWTVSPDRIAGSDVNPSSGRYFWKLSADNLLVLKWSQAHVYFFWFTSNMLCLCQYRPTLLRFRFQTDSDTKIQPGGEDLF